MSTKNKQDTYSSTRKRDKGILSSGVKARTAAIDRYAC